MATQVFDHAVSVSVAPLASQTWIVTGKTVVFTASGLAKMVIRPNKFGTPEQDRLVVFVDGDYFKYESDEVREYQVTLTNREGTAQDLYVTAY